MMIFTRLGHACTGKAVSLERLDENRPRNLRLDCKTCATVTSKDFEAVTIKTPEVINCNATTTLEYP